MPNEEVAVDIYSEVNLVDGTLMARFVTIRPTIVSLA